MPTPFTIRRAGEFDAEGIARAHVDSIVTTGPRFYSPEIVEQWGAPRNGERYLRAMQLGEQFFVAVSSAGVVGFSSYRVEKGRHRTAVYVSGAAARQGVGSALFEAAQQAAADAGAEEIHVSASLAAVDFYLAHDFDWLEEGEHLLGGSLPMKCVFMRKSLSYPYGSTSTRNH